MQRRAFGPGSGRVPAGASGRYRSASARSGFWFGVAEALLVPLCFAALGLAWWGVAGRAQAGPAAYPRAMQAEGELWLIDGFNVVQVALLAGRDRSEWWTATHRAELLRRARAFRPGSAAVELWVAFDGGRAAEDGEGAVHTVFAPSADDWVMQRVRAAPDPGRVRVVTADRRLAGRARHHGAVVVSPGAFLGLCGEVEIRSQGSSENPTT